MFAAFLCIAILIAVLDQIIKYFVVLYLQPVESVTAIPHLLNLVYVENKGVAFGMFSDMRMFFIIVTSVVIVLFLALLFKYRNKSKLFSLAAALIAGGGLGNLIDRVFHGYVVDYLQLSFFSPVCNFADYCITIGTVLLIIYLLFFSDFEKKGSKLKADSND